MGAGGAGQQEQAEEEAVINHLGRCRFCGCVLCSADSHAGLCDNLEHNGLLERGSTLAWAFRQVDRGDFVPLKPEEEGEGLAYLDAAIYLDFGAQISAPHVHAHALRLLFGESSEPLAREAPLRVLDVGSGSGFACAVLAQLLKRLRPRCTESYVLAVEHIRELADRVRSNLEKHHEGLLASGLLRLRCADGRKLLQEEPALRGAFAAAHCGCAVAPGEEGWLAEALAPGGRAVFPRGFEDEPQRLCVLEAGPRGTWELRETSVAVLYVPATSVPEQHARAEEWSQVVERCQRSSALVFG